MKNIIYTIAILLGTSFLTLQAQDISFTNTKLDPPAAGQEYGQACFTIIAEEGIELTSLPLVLDISMSKVNFDEDAITGINSDYFEFVQDDFSSNVIRATLIVSIPDVDNGGGGAQICIPVNADDYTDARNGFLVNLVPGAIEQNGNTANDHIQRFGFSQGYQTAPSNSENNGLFSNLETKNRANNTLNVFPNPASEQIQIEKNTSDEISTVRVYDNVGKVVYQNSTFISNDQIDIVEWTPGLYLLELRDENETIVQTEKVIVVK